MSTIPSSLKTPNPLLSLKKQEVPATSAEPEAAGSNDQLLLDQARLRAAQRKQEQAIKSAEEGAAKGGAVGNAVAGAYLVAKGMKGGFPPPVKMAGKAFSLVAVASSSYNLGTAGVNLAKDLSSPDLKACSAVIHATEMVANGLILGGSLAIASGVGAAPGTLALGAGVLLEAVTKWQSCSD